MKPALLLLSGSLVANAALVGVLVSRSPAPTPSLPAQPSTSASRLGPKGDADALRAALATGDAKALEAAGVAPEIARELALGRTFSRFADKVRANQGKKGEDRWWRSRSGNADPGSREQQLVARRELSDALLAAFGDDFGLGGGNQSQFSFLSPQKRDALRRINQDYDEMMARFGAGGVQLASDREKLRLLQLERDRDIAALLTPEERLAYEMRTSPSGFAVKSRYGDAIESEAEFGKIYALQKAFDDKFPRDALTGRISSEAIRARADAERQLESDLRSAIGDDRYAALRRAADPDVRTIDALATRLSLPAATTDTVLSSRDSYSSESQRINSDTSLTPPQRRAQIQALATQAKSDLTRTLGAEAGEAYAQRSPWVSMLQNGMAYTTTPQDGAPTSLFPGASQSVYPVMPPGAAAGQRQFVINAGPPLEGAAGGDGTRTGNVQVMSFSSSTSTDTAAAPAAGGVRQVIVAPNQGAAPTPPSANPAPRP